MLPVSSNLALRLLNSQGYEWPYINCRSSQSHSLGEEKEIPTKSFLGHFRFEQKKHRQLLVPTPPHRQSSSIIPRMPFTSTTNSVPRYLGSQQLHYTLAYRANIRANIPCLKMKRKEKKKGDHTDHISIYGGPCANFNYITTLIKSLNQNLSPSSSGSNTAIVRIFIILCHPINVILPFTSQPYFYIFYRLKTLNNSLERNLSTLFLTQTCLQRIEPYIS